MANAVEINRKRFDVTNKIKFHTDDEWKIAPYNTFILARGELGISYNTKIAESGDLSKNPFTIKVGDGKTPWEKLSPLVTGSARVPTMNYDDTTKTLDINFNGNQ